MSFLSTSFNRQKITRRYFIKIEDTSFKEELLAPEDLTVGSGYGMIVSLYKDKKMPLALNLALMTRRYYGTEAINKIDFMSDEISKYYPNLITPAILHCAKSFLKER